MASALSSAESTAAAIDACVAEAGAAGADLLFVWTRGHAPGDVLERLAAHDARLPAITLGCSAGALSQATADAWGAAAAEGTAERALSVCAAWLPRVEVELFALSHAELPPLSRMHERLQGPGSPPPSFFLFGSPCFDTAPLLRSLDVLFPESPKLGAVAYAEGRAVRALGGGLDAEPLAHAAHTAHVFGAGRVLSHGLVGVALSGDVTVDTVLLGGGLHPAPQMVSEARFSFGGGGSSGAPRSVRLTHLGSEGELEFEELAVVQSGHLDLRRARWGAQLPPRAQEDMAAWAGGHASRKGWDGPEDEANRLPWVPLCLIGTRPPPSIDSMGSLADAADDDAADTDDGKGLGSGGADAQQRAEGGGERAQGALVAPDSEGVCVSGVRIALCASSPGFAMADASFALAHAAPALRNACGALLFGALDRVAPHEVGERGGPNFGVPGIDAATVTLAANAARGAPVRSSADPAAADADDDCSGAPLPPLPLVVMHASAPIAPIGAGAQRSHVHRSGAALALLRPRAPAATDSPGATEPSAKSPGVPPSVMYACAADFAALMPDKAGVGGGGGGGDEPRAELAASPLPARVRRTLAQAEAYLPRALAGVRAPDAGDWHAVHGAKGIELNGSLLPEAVALLAVSLMRPPLLPGAERTYTLTLPHERLLARYCAATGASVGVLPRQHGTPGVLGRVVRAHMDAAGCLVTLRGTERFVAGPKVAVPLGFGLCLVPAHTFVDATDETALARARAELDALVELLRSDPLQQHAAPIGFRRVRADGVHADAADDSDELGGGLGHLLASSLASVEAHLDDPLTASFALCAAWVEHMEACNAALDGSRHRAALPLPMIDKMLRTQQAAERLEYVRDLLEAMLTDA